MFSYILILLLISNVQHYAYGAVLTTTVERYFPVNHNTNPATFNGVISFLGASDGLTSFLFSEPQDPSVMATYIAGNSLVEVIVSVPTLILSYSCDLGTTQAICLVNNIDPKNGQIVSTSTINDAINPVALVEVAPPSILTPAPSATGVTSPTQAAPSADTTNDAIQGLLPASPKGAAMRSSEALCMSFWLTTLSACIFWLS